MTVHEIRAPDAHEALVCRLEERMEELQGELRKGREYVADLQEKERSARELLLRIEGAVQVLREEIARVRAPAEQETPPEGDRAAAEA